MQQPESISSASKRNPKKRPTPRCCYARACGSEKKLVNHMKRPRSAEQTREAVVQGVCEVAGGVGSTPVDSSGRAVAEGDLLGVQGDPTDPPATTNSRSSQSFSSTPSGPLRQNVNLSFCFSLLSQGIFEIQKG